MSDYRANGDFTVNNGLQSGRVRFGGQDIKRRIAFRDLPNGDFKGYIQPANDLEVLYLRKLKRQLAAGQRPEDTPDYAEIQQREYTVPDTGEIKTTVEYVYPDKLINGEPLTLAPGEVYVFTSALPDFYNLDGSEKPISKGEKAALRGYACDYTGRLYEPAAFRRTGGFYGGPAQEFDLAAEKARMAEKSGRGAAE